MTASAGTGPLPCADHLEVWDGLFEDVEPESRASAHRQAVMLCVTCPRPCPEQVTAGSRPRALPELAEDWLPPTREGRSLYSGKETWHGTAAGVPTHGCHCARCSAAYTAHRERLADRARGHSLAVGRAYVPTRERVRVWATEAAALAQHGLTTAQIAARLCVTEQTAEQLLTYATKELTHA